VKGDEFLMAQSRKKKVDCTGWGDSPFDWQCQTKPPFEKNLQPSTNLNFIHLPLLGKNPIPQALRIFKGFGNDMALIREFGLAGISAGPF
jgi:hypothetical protein